MGSETPNLKLLIALITLLILNTFCISYIFLLSPDPQLSWTRTAAKKAEDVASNLCSGHGRVFLDSPLLHGRPTCECNNCYAGADCSQLLSDCPADADGGDPLFLEPYWRKHAANSAVVVSGWHRMSYQATGDDFISLELERHINLLHKATGNAVTDGRRIIFGTGSTQLTIAAIYALSHAAPPASVFASSPYYALYQAQSTFFDSKVYQWEGGASELFNTSSSSATNIIEFVTSPNNPDGQLKQPVLGGSVVIHDHAYYWPHYTHIPAPVDEDVMLFTISKVSGHASSRFGWALIKNETVYQKMVTYLGLNTMGVSRDTQLRILQIIKSILAEVGGEGDIFKFGYETQKQRWAKLNNVVSTSNRFSLQPLPKGYCTYFKKIEDPSPAYAWLKCERKEDTDCEAVLRESGIISRGGAIFGADSRYLRLSLIRTNDDFDQLLLKFGAMISKDKISSM